MKSKFFYDAKTMFRNALCGHAPVNETRDDNNNRL